MKRSVLTAIGGDTNVVAFLIFFFLERVKGSDKHFIVITLYQEFGLFF